MAAWRGMRKGKGMREMGKLRIGGEGGFRPPRGGSVDKRGVKERRKTKEGKGVKLEGNME